MTLTKVAFADSGLAIHTDMNDVQDNVETWVQTLDGMTAGSHSFTYNTNGTVSGISFGASPADGFRFIYNATGQVGSVIEFREGGSICSYFTYTGDQVTNIVREVFGMA